MKISIIIPVYNSELYLNKCLDSVINQDYSNLEILVINDGSSDLSEDIILDYVKKDARIIYIKKDNSGVSDSRNLGIKKATGKYIAFVDSDDWIERDYISSMVDLLLIKNVSCVKTNYYINYSNGSDFINHYELNGIVCLDNENEKKDFYLRILTGNIPAYVTTVLFERNILITNDIYFDNNLSMMEDTIFYLNYFNFIDKIFFDSSPKYHYFYNVNSASHSFSRASRNIDDLTKMCFIQNKILEKYKININKNEFYYFNYILLDNYLYDLFRYNKLSFKEKYMKLTNNIQFMESFKFVDYDKLKIYNKLSLKNLSKDRMYIIFIIYYLRLIFSKLKKK